MNEAALLEEIQTLANLGCWQWDVAANRVTWTDQLYRIYGLEPQEFGATFEGYLARVHPDDRERVTAAVHSAYAAGERFSFEERIVRPDGEVRLLQSSGRVERDVAGTALRLIGVCRDITDQRETEHLALSAATESAARQKADESAKRYRFIADVTTTLAESLDYEVTLRTVVNLAVPEVADWCAVDLLDHNGGLRRIAVAHPDPAKVELAHRLADEYPSPRDESMGVWRVLATGEPDMMAEIPTSLIETAAVDENHLAILRDLDLRSYVVVPVRAGEQTLGAMTFVHAESGRIYTDDDVTLLKDLACRAALAIQNAGTVRELEHAHARLMDQADELESQATELEVQAEELQVTLAELEIRNDELLASHRTAEDARDIAEEANRAKSQFLATMSHELRTPLNAISGYSELLTMGIHGPVTDAQVEALSRIQRNQRRLLALINDVLNFAKLDAGWLPVQATQVSVRELVHALSAVVEPQVARASLSLTVHEPEPSLSAFADCDRAEQVLLNLLSNAVKFTPAGGSIDIRCDEHEGRIRIHVIDTGEGIAEERQAQVFEPFVQVNPELRPDAGGVGLGLAISRDLARAMGGDLTLQSEPGVGSIFTLSLPQWSAALARNGGTAMNVQPLEP